MTVMIMPTHCFGGNENAYTNIFTHIQFRCILGSILPLLPSDTFLCFITQNKMVPRIEVNHGTTYIHVHSTAQASISIGVWLTKTHFHCLCQALTSHLHACTVYMKKLKCRQCLISEKFKIVTLNVSLLSQCKMSGLVLYTSVSHS